MPRWGEGAAKGTRQDSGDRRFKQGYVAAGTAGGLGVAGGGGLMMRSGGRQAKEGTRQATAQSERANRIGGQLMRESSFRNKNAEQMRGPRHIMREESRKIDELMNRPAVRNVNEKVYGYDPNAAPHIRGGQRGRITQAMRKPGYEQAVLEGNDRRRTINAQSAQIKPLREASEASEMKSKIMRGTRSQAETRAAAARAQAAAGLKRAKTGKRMAVGAAALPLAALATAGLANRTRKQVKRDWGATPKRVAAPPKDNYLPSKPDTHGMGARREEAAKRGDWDEYGRSAAQSRLHAAQQRQAERRRNGL